MPRSTLHTNNSPSKLTDNSSSEHLNHGSSGHIYNNDDQIEELSREIGRHEDDRNKNVSIDFKRISEAHHVYKVACALKFGDRNNATAPLINRSKDILSYQIRWCIENNKISLILHEMTKPTYGYDILIKLVSDIANLKTFDGKYGFVENDSKLKNASSIIKARALCFFALEIEEEPDEKLKNVPSSISSRGVGGLATALDEAKLHKNNKDMALNHFINHPEITPYAMIVALSLLAQLPDETVAQKEKKDKKIKLIIDHEKMPPLGIGEALVMAASHSNDNTRNMAVNYLINHEKMTPRISENALCDAALFLNEEMGRIAVDYLIGHEKMTNDNRRYALNLAASRPDDEREAGGQLLINHPKMTPQIRAEVLCTVTFDKNEEKRSLNYLINPERTTTEIMALALLTAVRHQHHDDIPPEEKERYILNSNKILDVLTSRPEVGDEAKGMVILRISEIYTESLRNACFKTIFEHDGIDDVTKQAAIHQIPDDTIQAQAQGIFNECNQGKVSTLVAGAAGTTLTEEKNNKKRKPTDKEPDRQKRQKTSAHTL